jgi:hypothetical protein
MFGDVLSISAKNTMNERAVQMSARPASATSARVEGTSSGHVAGAERWVSSPAGSANPHECGGAEGNVARLLEVRGCAGVSHDPAVEAIDGPRGGIGDCPVTRPAQ